MGLYALAHHVCVNAHINQSWQDPAKILSPFLHTAPLQYAPKIRFTQATIDCLTTNKTKNALHKETIILNHIGGDPISYSLSN